jgi:hypothetical protein
MGSQDSALGKLIAKKTKPNKGGRVEKKKSMLVLCLDLHLQEEVHKTSVD